MPGPPPAAFPACRCSAVRPGAGCRRRPIPPRVPDSPRPGHTPCGCPRLPDASRAGPGCGRRATALWDPGPAASRPVRRSRSPTATGLGSAPPWPAPAARDRVTTSPAAQPTGCPETAPAPARRRCGFPPWNPSRQTTAAPRNPHAWIPPASPPPPAASSYCSNATVDRSTTT